MLRARTKLKLTIASVVFHVVLGIIWSLNKVVEPLMWASLFTSFNATLATYSVAKTYKDKVYLENKKEE